MKGFVFLRMSFLGTVPIGRRKSPGFSLESWDSDAYYDSMGSAQLRVVRLEGDADRRELAGCIGTTCFQG